MGYLSHKKPSHLIRKSKDDNSFDFFNNKMIIFHHTNINITSERCINTYHFKKIIHILFGKINCNLKKFTIYNFYITYNLLDFSIKNKQKKIIVNAFCIYNTTLLNVLSKTS